MRKQPHNKIALYSSEQVFKKASKSATFKKVYKEEAARLALIRQLRQTRMAKKMTQKDLAEKANMPQSVIARIESGRHQFSFATLSRLASVFGKRIVLV